MTDRIEPALRAFFGFKALPFLKPTSSDDYLVTPDVTTGMEKLRYLADRRGIALLTGAPGTGKSTLLRAFMGSLSKTAYCVCYVAHTTCSCIDLLRLICRGFDIAPPHTRAEVTRALKERILKLSRQNKIHPILVLDEGHLLTGPFFDELRIITNYDGDSRDDLTILLAGHYQLESTLRLAVHEAFAQRVLFRIRLKGWDRDEVDKYIQFRLERAGRTAKLFLPDAIEAIWKASRGVPRQIDRAAEHALLIAFRQRKKEIAAEIINDVIEEIEP
jgi:type II secretory pathway predicted ATPase ExeA